jgi:hypothetical protein
MTLTDLETHVWDRLPTLQRVAGRRIANRVVRRAVAGWPIPVLEQCDDAEAAVVAKYYTRTVERSVRADMQMGFFTLLIFSALVQEVVKILVRWWMEKSENRSQMRLISKEARND